MASEVFNTTTTTHGPLPVKTYCRSADWTDVAKFILANYITHAFTVITRPGERTKDRIGFVLWSLFMPFAGVSRAIAVICMCARTSGNDLAMAHRAGALYTLVKVTLPSSKLGDGGSEDVQCKEEPEYIIPTVQRPMLKRLTRYYHQWGVQVHGKHPKFPAKGEKVIYYPARVTQRHAVTALPYPTNTESNETQHQSSPKDTGNVSVTAVEDMDIISTKQKICSQYNILKAALAIFQVLYGSWELYVARGQQLEKYGFAAFSLTVVPYVAMSLLNLLATIYRPEYSHVYLVQYEKPGPDSVEKKLNGLMYGAVGTICLDPDIENEKPRWGSYFLNRVKVFDDKRNHKVWKTTLNITVAAILGICAYGAPYLVAYILTGFKAEESGRLERIWIIVWLVFGQILSLVAIVRRRSIFSFNHLKMVGSLFVVGPLIVAPGLGVFVIAARMILEAGTCRTL